MNVKTTTKNELVKLNSELAEQNAALRAECEALRTQLEALRAGGQKSADPCKECTYASFKEATDNAKRLAKWARETAPGKYVVTQIGERVICKLRAGYKAARAA